jgi:hypothetical protein
MSIPSPASRRPRLCLPRAFFWLVAAALACTIPARAEVCNIKIVTDANPDYSDIGSMIYSITSNWPETKDKCWAIWYWNHIARRQTAPMILHGLELTDPIRQFNDYGYTMCSTVAGVNCGIWGAMGLDVKFWDVTLHTVPEVFYDGRYHMYDNSLSAIYTLCDGKTVAGVADIGAVGACAASGGKSEPGHIARYHCLNATSPNGFLTGADTARAMAEEYHCFNPNGLKYRTYLNNWDLGHRYVFNLRDGEDYGRYYYGPHVPREATGKPGESGPRASKDRAFLYYVPNEGKDPEAANPRYRIRGTGTRVWIPPLTAEGLAANAYSMDGVQAGPRGVSPSQSGRPGYVIFKIEGANVITSMLISAAVSCATSEDRATISISTTNGLTWKEVRLGSGDEAVLTEEVNGAYEVLVKIELLGKAAAAQARFGHVMFCTNTMLNSKTQPQLRLGKNTVYVGAGEQTESTVLWPDLQADHYKPYVVETKNVKTARQHPGYMGTMFAEKGGEEAYVVFKLDCPQDITRLTYGGRLYNRAPNAHIDFLHSFDGGKTWVRSHSLTDTTQPWDVIHHEKVEGIPAGTRSVLVKYLWNAYSAGREACSLYAVRMEANYRPPAAKWQPLEVAFWWRERQADGSFMRRSHRQLVEKVPCTYTINVGGADHPIVDSLQVNVMPAPGHEKYGYSDGKDVGGEKFRDRWVTYGMNLAEGKPYTCTVPSRGSWGAGDPQGKILTDGVVGSPYVGGGAYQFGALWQEGDRPVVTVDLGKPERCAAFRIQTGGWPFWDSLKGEVKDKIEVLASSDGKEYTSQGFFDFRLRWKDIPANFAWPDEETLCGPNYLLLAAAPVEARYVRFNITPARFLAVSEVQVLDSVRFQPFDLKIALPDGKDRSDITQYPLRHTPSKPR